MRKRKKRILTSIGIVTLLGVVWLVTPYERKQYTCLRCRMDRTVETYGGIPHKVNWPNNCFRWYMAEHPDHEHAWRKSSCTYRQTALTRTFRCGDPHPVFRVIREIQRTYLATHTAEEAEAWFALLDSQRPEDHQRAWDITNEILQQQLDRIKQQIAPSPSHRPADASPTS